MTTMSMPDDRDRGTEETAPHNDSSEQVATCKKCGYSWSPRKSLDQVKECPSYKTREWR